MVMDDGVTTRLDEYHYHMTTTTGGAAHVMGWLERWLQTEWPELQGLPDSRNRPVGDHLGSGPNAAQRGDGALRRYRFLRARRFRSCPVRQGTVAGVEARVFRISFSGELAYEVNVARTMVAASGKRSWPRAKPYGITPYGTEAMHVLRAEKGYVIVGQDTDGSVTPAGSGHGLDLRQAQGLPG